MYVTRGLAPILATALAQFPAVLVTGPRQSGKTTFLLHEFGEGARYLNLDDPQEREFARSDPNGFLDRFGEARVVLDEIQYAPELLPYLKIRIDRSRQSGAHPEGRWLLTGSQQFQLMANVSESLAGRIALLDLLPFSLLETAGVRPPDLQDVIWNGSYPEPALAPEKRDLWIASYIQGLRAAGEEGGSLLLALSRWGGGRPARAPRRGPRPYRDQAHRDADPEACRIPRAVQGLGGAGCGS